MIRLLRLFDKHSEYEAFTGTSEFILPNVSACEQENDVHYNPLKFASKIVFINPTTNVGINRSLTNPVTVREGDGAITYSSSDETIATVDANGKVSGVTIGNVTITATISETDFYLSAETSYSLEVGKSVSDIEFINPTTNVGINRSLTNSVTVNAGDGAITYSSSDETIATVDANGVVSGISAGEVIITATIAETDNYLSAETSYSLEVGKSVSDIVFVRPTTTVGVGSSVTNTVTVNAGDGAITYSSSDTTKATVDANGTVTAIGGGNVTITATISETDTYLSAETSYELTVEVPSFCVLTLDDGSTVEIEGSGELTQDMTSSYYYTCRGVKIGTLCTIIGSFAFRNFKSISSVTISNSVTDIDSGAFWSCSRLTSVTIPDSVTRIGPSAFQYCSGLTEVTIGSGVTEIDGAAFQYCTSLSSIISNAITAAPTIYDNTFLNINTGGTLTVPSGSSGYDVWMGTGEYYLGYYNWTKTEQ